MAKKQYYFKQKFYRSPEVNTKGHWAQDFVWPRLSSKGNETYLIHMHDAGWTCTCIGFSVRAHCKHVDSVINGFMEQASE